MKNNSKPSSILSLIGRLRFLGQSYITAALEEQGVHDIIPQHGDIIVSLGLSGPMSMGMLATATKRKKNTLTTLVQSLERNGYIMRQTTAEDGRVQQVSLTPKGQDIYKVTLEISTRMHASLWEGVEQDEQEECLATIKKLIDNLTHIIPD